MCKFKFINFLLVFFVLPMTAFPIDGTGESESVPSVGVSGLLPSFKWDSEFNYNEYDLGPGDVINLHVWGAKVFNTQIYVSSSFKVFIPFVGPIDVKGKTLGSLDVIVNEALAKRFKNVFAMTALFRPRVFTIRVFGAVREPGEKVVDGLMRLHQLFTGGPRATSAVPGAEGLEAVKLSFLKTTASTVKVEIYNELSKIKKVVNYQNYLRNGDLSGNPFIREGDVITVNYQLNTVVIDGELLNPGRFEFSEDSLPLKEVVENEMGGFSAENSISGQVVVTRIEGGENRTTYYEAKDFFNQKSPINYYNFQVRSGDKIYFPTSSINNPIINNVVFMTGEVKSPGPIKHEVGVPLEIYLSKGGGISSRGNYSGIKVYKASGQTVPLRDNMTIEPGDTIYVPEKTFKFWQDHLSVLTAFLSIVTITLSISR